MCAYRYKLTVSHRRYIYSCWLTNLTSKKTTIIPVCFSNYHRTKFHVYGFSGSLYSTEYTLIFAFRLIIIYHSTNILLKVSDFSEVTYLVIFRSPKNSCRLCPLPPKIRLLSYWYLCSQGIILLRYGFGQWHKLHTKFYTNFSKASRVRRMVYTDKHRVFIPSVFSFSF